MIQTQQLWIQSVILFTEHLQQDARSIEKNGHLKEHAKIQDDCILRHSLIIHCLL